MSDRLKSLVLAWGVPLAGLLAAGGLLAPLGRPASRAARPAPVDFSAPGVAVSRGVMMAALGGLRTPAADLFAVRAHVMWERRDRAACATYGELACLLAPETPAFREAAANRLGFDFAHWSVREAGGMWSVPKATADAFHRRDAEAALAMLESAMRTTPDEARFPLLAGQICQIKIRDESRAAAYYKRAAETTEAPWMPAMIYVDWLARSNRVAEARVWLTGYLRKKPPNSRSRHNAEEVLAQLGDG